jgi:hypothetical protein
MPTADELYWHPLIPELTIADLEALVADEVIIE